MRGTITAHIDIEKLNERSKKKKKKKAKYKIRASLGNISYTPT